jgi:hypothetical protein
MLVWRLQIRLFRKVLRAPVTRVRFLNCYRLNVPIAFPRAEKAKLHSYGVS